MPQGVLAYNPAAGRYPARRLTETAAKILREFGWEIKIEPTHSGNHITELALKAAKDKTDVFFVVGGDGSINYAVPGLMETDTALGVLPAGTSNVFAKEQGLPGLGWMNREALEESARRLATGKVGLCDVGICNKRPFLLWSGTGLDGYVVNRIEPRPRWEKNFAILFYAISVIWYALAWKGFDIHIEVDGVKIDGRFILSVVSNVHLYAGGLALISPQARLDDGIMDLWLFEGENIFDTIRLAWNLWTGNHQRSTYVRKVSFQTLHMDSPEPLFIELDGEPFSSGKNININVRSSAIGVLVPEETRFPLFESSLTSL
jgi:YegS/Rv2252/BmrU family lipid kinase